MSDRPVDDRVLGSVAAYSDQALAYSVAHASKRELQAARFAGSLPVQSIVLEAGCGPGRDLARFLAAGHLPIGVELNPAFITMATAVAPVVACDLREVGSHFPAGVFDGIWANAGLVHLDAREVEDVLGAFSLISRAGARLYASVMSEGSTGWLDEPDGRRWYTAWPAVNFANAIGDVGFAVDEVVEGPFVEVWATRR